MRAVLDGVQELGEHLRQRSTCGAAATFSSNAAAVLGRLRERGADKVLWSTTVWALLRFPLLFAPCARPLRPSHLLCKVGRWSLGLVPFAAYICAHPV